MRDVACALLWLVACAATAAAEPEPLTLEAKIPLGAVRGRIDHLAADIPRRRLFVAELGNDEACGLCGGWRDARQCRGARAGPRGAGNLGIPTRTVGGAPALPTGR